MRLRASRSTKRRAERQPGATRVGPRIEPSVRSNAVRTRSGATISSEKTIKAASLSRIRYSAIILFLGSQEAGQRHLHAPLDRKRSYNQSCTAWAQAR